jgi:hypothetical protein
MNRREITPEDDYQHPSSEDPLWREGYYFNGYDPHSKIGISIKMEIRPILGFRQELVSIHGEEPFLFLSGRKLENGDALALGTLKMEPVNPLKKWSINMTDNFLKVLDGNPSTISEKVEFDLSFESDMPPCGYMTDEGIRYEQPGFMEGSITIGSQSKDFRGKSIRDHSWGFRDVLTWGKFYMVMGWYKSYPLSFALMEGKPTSIVGWLKTDDYHAINNIEIDPKYAGNIIEECIMKIETSQNLLEMKSHLLSFFSFSREERGKKIIVTETLVELEDGYAFFWCR